MVFDASKRQIGRTVGSVVALLGLASLALHLIGAGDHGLAPDAGASLALALSGGALVLHFASPRRARLAPWLSGFAVLLLATGLAHQAATGDLVWPAIFFRGPHAAMGGGPHARVVQLLAALAVTLLARGGRSDRVPGSVWCASIVLAVTTSNLVAHLLARFTAEVRPFDMSPLGTATVLLLGAGVLASATTDHFGRILFAATAAGAIARRLAWGIIVIPTLLGIGAFIALRYQMIAPPYVLVLLMSGLAFCGFILFSALSRKALSIDDRRTAAETARDDLTARLQEQAGQLQQTVAARTRELREVNDTLRSAAAANARLALVASHSTNGIVICDALGRIEWVNGAFETSTGYTLAEIKGLKPGRLLQGPRTDPATISRLRHAVRQGEPCNVEILNYTKAGAPYWHILDIQPVRDQLGHLVNYVSIQTDTTEQHRQQEQLAVLTRRLRLATRSAALGVWEWTAATRRSVWDDRMLEIFGLAPGQFGATSDAWLQRVHPDDRRLAERALEAAGGGADNYDVEYRILRANDGAVRSIESHGIAQRDPDGGLLGLIGTARDVTDERQSAHQQTVLNERYQLALRSSNYGVWELDAQTQRLTWDDHLFEIYGLRRDEFAGRRDQWLSFIHADDREAAGALTASVLAGAAATYDHEFRIFRADGQMRHVEAHGYLQRDPRGQPLRLVGLARDVTAEKELTEALRVAEERWQLALSASNDGVWDWILASDVLFHDARSAAMLGYEPEQMPQHGEGWLRLIHPEDVSGFRAAVRDHRDGKVPRLQHEYRALARTGDWRWFLDRGQIVGRNGAGNRALRMVGTHTDITDRKRLDQRLQTAEQFASEVAELAQVGGWEYDVTRAQLVWSPLLKSLLDLDPVEQPTLEQTLGYFDPEGRVRFERALALATTTGAPFELEATVTTPRQRRVWLRVLGRADARQGRPARVRGSMQDVTARHSSESARLELEVQLFQTQKMETLGTFAGGIAHDFNNLLTGIIGYHELAADSIPDDHPARACLHEARHASLRARELVEQILTFGRQSHAADHSPVEFGLIVEEARRFLRATIPASIEIEAEVSPDCGVILADSTQLHQVLLNLGSNAAHAMRQSGGTFRLVADSLELGADRPATLSGLVGGRYVRLTVSDTGHGMDEATLRRIFDPFFTTKNTREGTGLGLAVVHGIIRAHRGAIDVESTVGRGTTFRIYLPAPLTADAGTEAAVAEPVRGSGEHIFVVDDEELIASCATLALQRKGYSVTSFISARQCLAALDEGGVSCAALVTDQTMPGMPGTELAQRIRLVRPDLPIVIMSGYFSKISSHALKELNPVELLAKPFTTDELCRAVERAFAIARAATPRSPDEPASPSA